MKWKKQSGSISAKLFYIYMVLFLVTGIVLFSSFFLRFEHIYRQQADSHMADITDMSAENIRNMEEQIDQFFCVGSDRPGGAGKPENNQ